MRAVYSRTLKRSSVAPGRTYIGAFICPRTLSGMSDKSETYSVEADNAELRHYLARLARRSRCFSRCIEALAGAIKLFVFAWNRRQLFRRAQPTYPAHVCDFLYP